MSLRRKSSHLVRLNRPIAVEFALVTALLVGLYLWQHIITAVLGFLPAFGGILVGTLSTGGLFVAGLVLFTAAYTSARDIESGLALPLCTDLSLIGLAGVTPIVFVGFTKLVGTLTTVPYNSLTMTAYAADAPILPVLFVTGVGIVVGVPTLVLVCQVLVQGSFNQVVGGNTALGLTTLVTGFAMVSTTGGLAMVPDRGKLIGTVLFALFLGVALYATEHTTRDRLRYLAYVPLLLFTVLIILSGIAEIESIAGGLFAVTHVTVLGIAAYTYERTNSLLIPACAYISLSLADTAVVYIFEAGMHSW